MCTHDTHKKQLVLAATDGHRLAEFTIPLKDSGEGRAVVLPLSTVSELQRILPDEEINIGLGENQAQFQSESMLAISRLIESDFIDYKALFPENFDTEMTINRDEFTKAVRATSLFARRNIQDVNLEVKDSDLIITAEAEQVGSGETKVPVEITGARAKIVFNAQYLVDGLNSIDTDQLEFHMNTEKDPAVLKGKGSENQSYLLMPINL